MTDYQVLVFLLGVLFGAVLGYALVWGFFIGFSTAIICTVIGAATAVIANIVCAFFHDNPHLLPWNKA